MKRIINKFKKLKNIYKILFIITSIFFLFSIIFLTKNLLLLKNIETIIRTIIIIILYPIFFIYLFLSIILLFSKKNKIYIINTIITLLISIIFTILSIYITKTYNIVDNMVKDTVTYSSSLITLKNTEFKNNKDFVVGMINDENDIEGNILANKLIDKKNLNKIDIKYYSNYLEMLSDLYNDKVDGIFIGSGYVINYSSYENYKTIEKDTKTIYSYKEELKNKETNLISNKSLTEPFTILLLGVDSTIDGLNASAAFNGDTIMLVTFNPNTLNATIFSIPRDTYVPISCNGNNSNKINSSAAGGISCVIKTIENLIDINIDYYVKINFKGVVDLVDSLNGITVNVPIDFCEQNSDRKFGKNEICLKKGEQTLNGEQALALARHRHTLPTGDFQRIEHQQLLVESTLNKIKSIRSIDQIYEVLEAISKNVETNISTEEILNLYNVGKKIIFNNNTSLNIEKAYLTGYDLTMYIPGLGNVYTFQYYEQSLKEIIESMKINLEIKKPTPIKTFNFSANKTYEPPVIGKKYYNEEKNEALPNFVDSTIQYLQEWASIRKISVKIDYITENMSEYDGNKNNIIIEQDIRYGTLVSTIDTINVKVIKVENNVLENNDNEINESNNDEELDNNENNTSSNEEIDTNIDNTEESNEVLDDIINLN